jgi:beta-barrel assembly-enhancing protease
VLANVASAESEPPRFERPALDTDEGGLWAMMDREETRLRRSPLTVRDAALNTYVSQLIGRLSPVHAPDVRLHIVRTPYFNASMAPNGMMQVWTGLLLRVENEAQLAGVLGHELAHYMGRHSLQGLRDVKSRAAFAQFMGMFGVVGLIGQLGTMAGLFSFSREQETSADRVGLMLTERAGWNGQEVAHIWGNLLEEAKVRGGEDVGKRSAMFATHPAILERKEALLKAASGKGTASDAQLRSAIAPMRLEWIQDEVRRGQFDESLVLFDRLIKLRERDVAARFGRAETYRLRAGTGDGDLALADYRDAIAAHSPTTPAPAACHRGVGLILRKAADKPGALSAFEAYLREAPQAPDAGLIQQYVSELKA